MFTHSSRFKYQKNISRNFPWISTEKRKSRVNFPTKYVMNFCDFKKFLKFFPHSFMMDGKVFPLSVYKKLCNWNLEPFFRKKATNDSRTAKWQKINKKIKQSYFRKEFVNVIWNLSPGAFATFFQWKNFQFFSAKAFFLLWL